MREIKIPGALKSVPYEWIERFSGYPARRARRSAIAAAGRICALKISNNSRIFFAMFADFMVADQMYICIHITHHIYYLCYKNPLLENQ